jgi:hypothetical protein
LPLVVANDSCNSRLYLGGVFGYLAVGTTMTFPGVDNASITLFADAGGVSPGPVEMFLARLVP